MFPHAQPPYRPRTAKTIFWSISSASVSRPKIDLVRIIRVAADRRAYTIGNCRFKERRFALETFELNELGELTGSHLPGKDRHGSSPLPCRHNRRRGSRGRGSPGPDHREHEAEI